MKAGAKSYIHKTAKAIDIIRQIRLVHQEGRIASPELEQKEMMIEISQV